MQPQFIILTIITLVLLVFGVPLFWRHRDDKEYDMWEGWQIWTGFITSLIGGLLLITTLITMIPFNPAYWTYNPVTGAVQSVSNRFVSGSGDLSEDFVVKLAGHSGVYNVQDDRIQGVKVGDRVDLTCTLQWVIAGQDQRNCFIRSWR